METPDPTLELLQAARRGDVAAIDKWIAAGADIHQNRETILINAARAGHRDAVRRLCYHGAYIGEAILSSARTDDMDALVELLDCAKNTRMSKSLRAAFHYLEVLELTGLPLKEAPIPLRNVLPPPGQSGYFELRRPRR